MPLPDPGPGLREELHLRRVECRAFRRANGLFDIEARLFDTRSFDLTHRTGRTVVAGEPIHDMWLRLRIDVEMVVQEVAAATDASPFGFCGNATAAMQRLKGLRIGPGWTRRVKELLGGRQGCTHLMELLGPAATTAVQALVQERWNRPERLGADGRPAMVDSCYAYASDRPVVRQLWPDHYTGPADDTTAPHSVGQSDTTLK